jgi:hypothetical protein
MLFYCRSAIEELERRPELKHLGVFRDDWRRFSEGSAVTPRRWCLDRAQSYERAAESFCRLAAGREKRWSANGESAL